MYMVIEQSPEMGVGGGNPFNCISYHTTLEAAQQKQKEMQDYYKDLENTRSVYRGWSPKFMIVQTVG